MGTKTSEIIYTSYSLALDYDATGNLIYFGRAEKGALQSAAVWAINRLDYDVNDNLISILWADGNGSFDNVWNNRTVLSYN